MSREKAEKKRVDLASKRKLEEGGEDGDAQRQRVDGYEMGEEAQPEAQYAEDPHQGGLELH